ncbi:phosphotransferase enzyme family protein [Bordetella sp. LUAb4]|uniref:phosphotransferase enzyme family protein n=1 Tax=Bordetella sp. LUAb4 TaxID=2843195 RepID=UPI001E54F87F|nr:phosphotransferase [Bordetella sp. LUAb4]
MHLSADVLDEIYVAYGLSPGMATTRASRVSERVWRFSTAKGGVAVKFYGQDQLVRARKETALVAYLNTQADHRFRVQTLLRTTAGAPLWLGPHARAMVTAWAPGATRTYDTYTLAEWAALGASLASLHLSLDQYPAAMPDTLLARLAAFDIDEIRRELGQAEKHGLQTYVDACLRLIDQHYAGSLAGFPTDDPQRPIHNDYNQFNYLFGETLPPLVLDWEASIGAPREYEVVRCLNHLPLEAPASAAAFVQAYLRWRPLRIERMAWAVDAASLQHALKRWMLQGWLSDPQRYATHLQGAMRMVSMMAGARASLIDFFLRCIEEGN